MAGKRVLITGAAGFIGACLARRMVELGEDVHLLLRKDSKTWRISEILKKCSVHQVDISDREKVAAAVGKIRPETAYHLATYGGYSTQKDEEMMVRTNLLGGMNVLDACTSAGCGRLVNVSSSSEYGLKEKPMMETDVLEPNSMYGVTKAAFTNYCTYAHAQKGAHVTTFRIFAAYGYYEDQMRLMPSLITACLRNEAPKLTSPGSVRDFIFVEDVLGALMRAPEVPEADGEILNLGTGMQRTVGEAAQLAIELSGCSKQPEWGVVGKRQVEPKSWVADMGKTGRILGWKPRHNLRTGMGKTIAWFRKNMEHYGEGGA
jgi:nucleoside-diphosphate-sugar epimerase